MPGTSSAKTRFALLPGHDDYFIQSAALAGTNSSYCETVCTTLLIGRLATAGVF